MAGKRCVILSYDAVSPLGIDLETQWENALHGKSGVKKLTRFDAGDDFPVKASGEVSDIDHLNYPFLKSREEARWPSPLFKHALLTVQRAMDKSGIVISNENSSRVAITYSSAVGGVDAVLAADRRWQKEKKLPQPFTTPNSCINMVGGKISMLTGATGPFVAPVTACATGLTSIILGALFLEQGMADVAICGAVDFPLVEPIIGGFSTMNAAYSQKEGEAYGPFATQCRPFSCDRRGFVVSEGAACLIIATHDFAKTHGLPYDTEIAGWALNSDAHHYVAPHLKTVTDCMASALTHAGVSHGQINAINAHATATRVGDQVEFDAINTIFQSKIPQVSANKSLMGHAMGASSAIESIFAIMGMRDGYLPPTINHKPDIKIPLGINSKSKMRLDQDFVLKNAFGFGGCNASIIFQRANDQ